MENLFDKRIIVSTLVALAIWWLLYWLYNSAWKSIKGS